MKLYYRFTKGEEDRYFAACESIAETVSAGRVAAMIHQQTGRYVSGQTVRDWFNEVGRVPTDVAAMVLVKEFDIKLEHLCPWLKGHLRGRAA